MPDLKPITASAPTTGTPALSRTPSAPDTPPRLLGRVEGPGNGRTLICLAGLHGNEPCGVRAAEGVLAKLSDDPSGIAGRLVVFAGNRKALPRRQRYLDKDLNRSWQPSHLERLRDGYPPADAEDEEIVELDRELEAVMAGEPGEIFLIDMHSTSGPGPAFAVLEDTLDNRAFALKFPIPLVLGLEEELSGTVSSFLCARGVTTLGFEGGQHEDPASVRRAAAALWIALEETGVLPRGSRSEPAAARAFLETESRLLPRVVEVLRRHAIHNGDGFRMIDGYDSFQAVRADERVATDRRGGIPAAEEGLILMPLYQDQGDDGFFIVRRVRPVWLRVSAFLRRGNLDRHLHRLPGVSRNPERADGLIVDRRVARWLTMQLFHLFGYRRYGADGRHLKLSRRAYRE